jgi:hypothetical protein
VGKHAKQLMAVMPLVGRLQPLLALPGRLPWRTYKSACGGCEQQKQSSSHMGLLFGLVGEGSRAMPHESKLCLIICSDFAMLEIAEKTKKKKNE